MVALDKIEVPSGQKDGVEHGKRYQTIDTKNCKNASNLIITGITSCVDGGDCKCGATGDLTCGGGVNVNYSDVVVPVIKNSQNECSTGHNSSNFIVQYFKKKTKSWSRNQFITIVILSFVEFFAAAVVSIQAPFYPDVAQQKGASATEYGFVFAIFEITVFIMSPIYGSKMGAWGPRRVFNYGILVTGVCCVIFGLLDTIEGRVPFIGSCLVVRVFEAMGDAAFDTASFTIIAMEFPDSVATSFAILEIWYGCGLIIGPTLGGFLYEIGGYKLPFLAMGGFLFVAAIATYFFLPEPSQRSKSTTASTKWAGEDAPVGEIKSPSSEAATVQKEEAAPVGLGGFHMFRMLKIPVIAMTAYSIVAATAGVGFISANLDAHLEQFNLNKIALGAVFILNGGTYAVTAPAWGWICDHTDNQKVITFAGAILTILGFIFIGPVPGFPYDTSLPLACFGLALFGFGLAATLVSAFLQVLNDAITNTHFFVMACAHGYSDDISTYGLVSGLWTSMSALGYFIGPSIGGIAVDLSGFQWASLIIIGGQIILIIELIGYYFARGRRVTKFKINQNQEEAYIEGEDAKNHNSINNIKANFAFVNNLTECEVPVKRGITSSANASIVV